MAYSLISSISLEDESTIASSTSNKDGNLNDNLGSPNKSLSSSTNEIFLRNKYLENRAKKLRKRLADRPFDERALVEYAEVSYEQKNFLVSQKIIRRVLATGDCSGYWYLKLGKCCFRRWLIYAQANG
jgi:hypothetical protein